MWLERADKRADSYEQIDLANAAGPMSGRAIAERFCGSLTDGVSSLLRVLDPGPSPLTDPLGRAATAALEGARNDRITLQSTGADTGRKPVHHYFSEPGRRAAEMNFEHAGERFTLRLFWCNPGIARDTASSYDISPRIFYGIDLRPGSTDYAGAITDNSGAGVQLTAGEARNLVDILRIRISAEEAETKALAASIGRDPERFLSRPVYKSCEFSSVSGASRAQDIFPCRDGERGHRIRFSTDSGSFVSVELTEISNPRARFGGEQENGYRLLVRVQPSSRAFTTAQCFEGRGLKASFEAVERAAGYSPRLGEYLATQLEDLTTEAPRR